MAVPKRRVTRSRRDMRRSHHHIEGTTLSIDTESNELHLRHHVTSTGFHRGRRVVPESTSSSLIK